MKTPKSTRVDNGLSQQLTTLKPKSSTLMHRSSARGTETTGFHASHGPEDPQASKFSASERPDYDAMFAVIDLNPEVNSKKVYGKVEPKLLKEKIQHRKVKLGLLSDEELIKYNSTCAASFNTLVPRHLEV